MLNALRSLGHPSLRENRRQAGHRIRFFCRFPYVLDWYSDMAAQQP